MVCYLYHYTIWIDYFLTEVCLERKKTFFFKLFPRTSKTHNILFIDAENFLEAWEKHLCFQGTHQHLSSFMGNKFLENCWSPYFFGCESKSVSPVLKSSIFSLESLKLQRSGTYFLFSWVCWMVKKIKLFVIKRKRTPQDANPRKKIRTNE